MEAQLQELLPFLHDRNPQVRQIALANLLGHTPAGSPHRNIFFAGLGGGEGLQSLKAKDTELVRDLKLLCRDQLAVAHDAFRALINLSDSPPWVTPLSEMSFLVFLVSYILHPPSVLADLASMLLSNLTAHHSVCTSLLSLKIPVVQDSSLSYRYYPTQSRSGTSPNPSFSSSEGPIDIQALPLLVDAFASSAKVNTGNDLKASPRKGELHFLSSVFANLSVVRAIYHVAGTPPGRLFFVTPRPVDPLTTSAQAPEMEYPVSKLISFTEYADTIRRGGVASVIKNCSFHSPAHRALLSLEGFQVAVPPSTTSAPGVNILPAILLPLAGPEEFDLDDQEKLLPTLQFLPPTKQREPDSVLRLTHVETLLLLCTTRWGRDFLRENGTYEIIRTMHENETVDKISEHVERLVVLLKGDEREEGEGDAYLEGDNDNVSEDERIEEI